MSEHKHTPGPWRFSSDGYIVSSATGERVCSPHSTLLGGKVSDQIKDLKRNARLIAASPELLEALTLLLRSLEIEQRINGGLDPRYTTIDIPRAIKIAETAIAKATGGAS
jgi:hypothetical protein